MYCNLISLTDSITGQWTDMVNTKVLGNFAVNKSVHNL